jgi:MSHA biogenesis protein MshG
MPQYTYRGRHRQGHEVDGTFEAADADTVSQWLLSQQVLPVSIELQVVRQEVDVMRWWHRRVSTTTLQFFARQMYTLLAAGLSVFDALSGLIKTTESIYFKATLMQVYQQLGQGKALSDALHQHPKTFNAFFVAMVHMGEQTGQLDMVFKQLAHYLERQDEINKQVQAALRYPKFVLTVILFAFLLMNIYVIPSFVTMFDQLGTELPLPTQVIMAVSQAVSQHGWVAAAVVVTGLVGWMYWAKTTTGALWVDTVQLRMPVLGNVLERTALARFSRCFAVMLQSGVALNNALTLAADVVNNRCMQAKIHRIRHLVEEGTSLTQAAYQSQLLPPLVLQMLAMGESSGRIESLMLEVAAFYEREVDYDIKKLTSRLEPILITLMALMIMILAMGIYLPMWSMMDAVI